MMRVWTNNETEASIRLVLDKSKYNIDLPYLSLSYINDETKAFEKFNSGEVMQVGFWKYAKEIEEPQIEVKEMTMEEICKALGKNIKIIK